MIKVLNNFKNNLVGNGKIVFTSPLIKLSSGQRISCDYEKIFAQTGFKLAEGFPIPEFRENQIVGRNIFAAIK